MTEWKDAFTRGIACFRAQQYEQALAIFSEVISLDVQDASLFDSRAAVYEKLGKKKEALLDSKQVIRLAPDQWKGYARSARLFHSARKYDSALKMINLALARLRPEDTRRFAELEKLQKEIISCGEADAEFRRRKARETFCHFGKLPIELAMAIFNMVLEGDRSFVVILGQVSREWRSFVLGTPTFWDTLVLTNKNPVRKAKIWKERSQGRLRRLDLRDGDMKTIWALNEFHSTPLNSLRELSLRSVRADHFFKILPTCTPAVLRNLEYLQLDGLLAQSDNVRFTQQPQLQLHHLVAYNTKVHWPNVADNCRQLRTLVYGYGLDPANVQDLTWLLHSNPHLEHLELALYRPPVSEADPTEIALRDLPQQVVMPNLTRLVLAGGGRSLPPTRLLSTVTCPSLQTLHLMKISEPIDDVLDHLLTTGSVSRLKEVKVESCIVRTPEALLSLLDATVGLETILISRINSVEPLVEKLVAPVLSAEGTQSKVCCPKLSRVELTHCTDVRTGSIMRLVRLHNGQSAQPDVDTGISKITTLVLDGCHIDTDVLPWLRQQVPVLSCVYQTGREAKWKR